MSVKENEELIRRYITADIKEVQKTTSSGKDEYHSPEFKLHSPRGTVNLEDYYKVNERLNAAFPDRKYTVDDVFGKEDKVVARYTLNGTHKGSYMGISPTGKKITFEGIGIFKVSGGRLAEAWGINDTYGLMQQLGAIPAPKK